MTYQKGRFTIAWSKVEQLAEEMDESGLKGLRGSAPTRIDEKGRLKVPTLFRGDVQEAGPELFVTSVTGECVRLYPMRIWKAVEQRLVGMPLSHPSLTKFLDRVNYFGQAAELDAQGRVLIPTLLRERAAIQGDVRVVGRLNHLEVWNEQRLNEKIERDGWTVADQLALAEFRI